MIKELPESEGSLLGFEITGKVSLEEEKEWIGKFNDAIEKHGKVRVLSQELLEVKNALSSGITILLKL
jgi:hypothetical protein